MTPRAGDAIAAIAIPEAFDMTAYMEVLGQIHWYSDLGAEGLTIDFSLTKRAYPDGMVPLISTVSALRGHSTPKVNVVLPVDDDLRGVFEGVGWAEYLGAPVAEFQEIPRITRNFTPIRPFRTSAEAGQLHAGVVQVLLSQSRLAQWVPEAIHWSLWEVMDNVLRHAETQCGWVQAVTFREKKHVNIVVADGGIGILSSLSRPYPHLLDDRKYADQRAIKLAVEEGITRDPTVGAGYGLTGCRDIVLNNGGVMLVYSGHYRLLVKTGKTKEETLFSYRRSQTRYQGTVVELGLRMDRPVDLEETLGAGTQLTILEQTRDTEEGFRFAVLEEATNLGTREAGRELRTRLLNLIQVHPNERVILDFGDIHMISSSFADEFVAKLAVDLGGPSFRRRIFLRNLSSSVRTVIDRTLKDRLIG